MGLTLCSGTAYVILATILLETFANTIPHPTGVIVDKILKDEHVELTGPHAHGPLGSYSELEKKKKAIHEFTSDSFSSSSSSSSSSSEDEEDKIKMKELKREKKYLAKHSGHAHHKNGYGHGGKFGHYPGEYKPYVEGNRNYPGFHHKNYNGARFDDMAKLNAPYHAIPA